MVSKIHKEFNSRCRQHGVDPIQALELYMTDFILLDDKAKTSGETSIESSDEYLNTLVIDKI